MVEKFKVYRSKQMKPIKRTIDFLEYKIKDLKKRRPRLIDEVSKFAITSAIDELKEVLEYAKDVNDANQKQDEVKKDE